MNYQSADIILRAKNIFTAKSNNTLNGYLAIAGNRIIAVNEGNDYEQFVSKGTMVINLEDKLVSPGFVDTHTFFSGYVVKNLGIDMSEIYSVSDCVTKLKEYIKENKFQSTIFASKLDLRFIEKISIKLLDDLFKQRSIIIFSDDGNNCVMNSKAIAKYQFTPDECYPEAYWRIMKEYLNDNDFIEQEFKKYMQMMNSKGITAVKEMGFDNFYGFTDCLAKLEAKEKLDLRVSFMSQPVGENINIDYGIKMKEKFTGDFVRFSGFNSMTDGSISEFNGDLINGYKCCDLSNELDINYKKIEENVLLADKYGFRYSLHAQGDRAVKKALDIFNKCEKKNGKCLNRHVITDLEFSDPVDLERMGQLGVIGEIYPQIMSLKPAHVLKKQVAKTVGIKKSKYYWNRRKMVDSGVVLSCATDLPLMIPDIPESIYYSCGGYLPQDDSTFNYQNTLTISELLKAWTIGGQYNCGLENKLGTLEVGKLADITVLDKNVFKVPMSEMNQVQVCFTIVDGSIVYNDL